MVPILMNAVILDRQDPFDPFEGKKLHQSEKSNDEVSNIFALEFYVDIFI